MLSVSADEQRKRASSEKASERKTAGREMERTYKHIFQNLSPPTSRKTVSRIKMCGEGRLHSLTMFVWSHVCSVSVDVKLSELTDQRVTRSWYTETEVLKTMLTGSTSLSCPTPHEGFGATFLGVQDRLLQGDCSRAHDKVADTSMLSI